MPDDINPLLWRNPAPDAAPSMVPSYPTIKMTIDSSQNIWWTEPLGGDHVTLTTDDFERLRARPSWEEFNKFKVALEKIASFVEKPGSDKLDQEWNRVGSYARDIALKALGE